MDLTISIGIISRNSEKDVFYADGKIYTVGSDPDDNFKVASLPRHALEFQQRSGMWEVKNKELSIVRIKTLRPKEGKPNSKEEVEYTLARGDKSIIYPQDIIFAGDIEFLVDWASLEEPDAIFSGDNGKVFEARSEQNTPVVVDASLDNLFRTLSFEALKADIVTLVKHVKYATHAKLLIVDETFLLPLYTTEGALGKISFRKADYALYELERTIHHLAPKNVEIAPIEAQIQTNKNSEKLSEFAGWSSGYYVPLHDDGGDAIGVLFLGTNARSYDEDQLEIEISKLGRIGKQLAELLRQLKAEKREELFQGFKEVFVIAAKADKRIQNQVERTLRSRKTLPWTASIANNLGNSINENLVKKLNRSACVILLITENLSNDDEAMENLSIAWSYGKTIWPVLVNHTSQNYFPYFLRDGRTSLKDDSENLIIFAREIQNTISKTAPTSEYPKTRVLFAGASPRNRDRLKIEEEAELIEQSLGSNPRFDIYPAIINLKVREVTQKLSHVRPNIFHFSGHGDSEGNPLLLDEQDNASSYPIINLLQACRFTKSQPVIVVLNNCTSNQQAESLKEMAHILIVMSSAIPDDVSREFSNSFYTNLANHQSVGEAFDRAKSAVEGTLHANKKGGIEPLMYHWPEIKPDKIFLG